MNSSSGTSPQYDEEVGDRTPVWMLHTEHHDRGSTWVLALSGESDVASRDVLAHEVAVAEGRQRERLVFDVTSLRFCDAASVEIILGAAQRGWVGLTGANASIRRVFELLDPNATVHRAPPAEQADLAH